MGSTLEDQERKTTLIKSLECPICLYQFVDPKMLTCMHTICERCLKPLVKENEVVCPTCRYVTKVDHGWSSIASDWVLQRKIAELTLEESIEKGLVTCSECEEETSEYFCANCRLMLCGLCSNHHKRVARYKNHHITAIKESNVTVADNTIPRTCEKHNEMLKYFCSTCDVTLCLDCTLSSAHKSHQFALLNEVIEAKIDDLKTVIQRGKDFYEGVAKKLSTAHRILDDVSTAKTSSVEIVTTCFDSIITSMCEKKQEFIDWLETGHRESEQSINKVTKELIVLKNSLEYGSKLTEVVNQADIISAVLHTATKIQTMLDSSLHEDKSSSTHQSDTENPFKIIVKKREIQDKGNMSKVILIDTLKEVIDLKAYVQREAPIASYDAHVETSAVSTSFTFRPITCPSTETKNADIISSPIMSTGIKFGPLADIATSTGTSEQSNTLVSTTSGGVTSVSTASGGATSASTASGDVTSVSTASGGVTSVSTASWGVTSVSSGIWGVTSVSTGSWGVTSLSEVVPSSSYTFVGKRNDFVMSSGFTFSPTTCIDSTSTKPITNVCNAFETNVTSAGNGFATLSPNKNSKAIIPTSQSKIIESFGSALKDNSSFQFTFPTSANFSFTPSTNSSFTFGTPTSISGLQTDASNFFNVTNSYRKKARYFKNGERTVKTTPLTCIETLYQ